MRFEEFLLHPLYPAFSLVYIKTKSRVKVQEKPNHEKKQQWKKEHDEKDEAGGEGRQSVQEKRGMRKRGSERKRKRWTARKDDE